MRWHMIVDTKSVISNFKSKLLNYLYKLSALEKWLDMKVNKSALARELNVNRWAIKKHCDKLYNWANWILSWQTYKKAVSV